MPKRKQSTALTAIQAVGSRTIVRGVEQLAGGDQHSALVLFGTGLLLQTLGSLLSPVSERAGRLLASYRSAKTVADQPAREEPSQGMLEAVRRYLEAPSADVGEPLGRLVAMYDSKPIDGFFRGTARLLCDLSDDEHTELTKLLKACERRPGDDPYFLLGHSPRVRQRVLLETGGSDMPQQHYPNEELKLRHSRRLTALLRTNTLAEDGKGVSIGSSDHATPHSFTVDTELPRLTAESLYRVVVGKEPRRTRKKHVAKKRRGKA